MTITGPPTTPVKPVGYEDEMSGLLQAWTAIDTCHCCDSVPDAATGGVVVLLPRDGSGLDCSGGIAVSCQACWNTFLSIEPIKRVARNHNQLIFEIAHPSVGADSAHLQLPLERPFVSNLCDWFLQHPHRVPPPIGGLMLEDEDADECKDAAKSSSSVQKTTTTGIRTSLVDVMAAKLGAERRREIDVKLRDTFDRTLVRCAVCASTDRLRCGGAVLSGGGAGRTSGATIVCQQCWRSYTNARSDRCRRSYACQNAFVKSALLYGVALDPSRLLRLMDRTRPFVENALRYRVTVAALSAVANEYCDGGGGDDDVRLVESAGPDGPDAVTATAQSAAVLVDRNEAPTEEETDHCNGCIETFPMSALKQCGRCGIVFYCSKACQVEDHARHRKPCLEYRKMLDLVVLSLSRHAQHATA
ncbi:Hypothetical protein UVM_LOCUS137 [uncultured virus]|nr:Hypothetical protein UVM_LOCUS137 [uncultured virus]